MPTHLCWRDEDRRYVLDHLPELFVKPANASGGYGMLVGPTAGKAELSDFRQRIEAAPRNRELLPGRRQQRHLGAVATDSPSC